MLPPWVWLLHFRVETRHVHAERHLAKAGVARRKGRGLPTGAKRRRPKAGLHKRSAEDWGYPCAARSGRSPLAQGSVNRSLSRSGWLQGGRCGRERPAEVGGGGPQVRRQGGDASRRNHRRYVRPNGYYYLSLTLNKHWMRSTGEFVDFR